MQHVQVFKTKALGNVLVLDGVVQVTEMDEMSYQGWSSSTFFFSFTFLSFVCRYVCIPLSLDLLTLSVSVPFLFMNIRNDDPPRHVLSPQP